MQAPIRCETLGELNNGMAGLLINRLIREATNDLEARGDDNMPRVVTIKLGMKKIGDADVGTVIEAKLTLPPMRTETTVALLCNRAGTQSYDLLFQTQNSENPRQPTLIDHSETPDVDEP